MKDSKEQCDGESQCINEIHRLAQDDKHQQYIGYGLADDPSHRLYQLVHLLRGVEEVQ